MRKTFLSLLLLLLYVTTGHADDYSIYDLMEGQDYYIYCDYYKRPLGINAEGNGPYLIAYDDSKDADYLWQVERLGTDEYVLLKQKSSGKYMVASTANTWAVQFTETRETANNYQWKVKPGMEGSLSNRKSSSKRLGIDKNETGANIGVWYDKSGDGETTRFAIFPANGNGLESSRRAYAEQDLRNVMEIVASEAENRKNPLTLRNKLKTSLGVAQAMIDDKTSDLTQLQEKAGSMRDSLATMVTTNEASVLLAQGDMAAFGNTFSLGISNLTMNHTDYPADSLLFIIRGNDGRGARIYVKEDGNYVFVKKGNQMQVYNNGEIVQTMSAVYLPKFTLQDTEAEWTILRKSRLKGAQPEILSQTDVVTTPGQEEKNKYGNNTRSVVSMTNTALVLDHQVDFHIISEEAPLTGCTINLTHEKAWIIFDNTQPSKVASDYLKNIKINGKAAVKDENCRIVIYLNGTLVMPLEKKGIFIGYDGEQYSGNAMSYSLGSIADLKKNSNRIRSFRLKRGYMVTLASDKNGKGYSRVYVADHKDLEVPVLPNALYCRISSIHVKKWQYVSKKGYCSTKGSVKSNSDKTRSTWFYTWSADNSSSMNQEYIPIRQHRYWPSISDIARHEDATACLSINEPEHSEQHNNCDCGGALNEWTCCTLTPDFQSTGMRIGSPAPTDAGWLKNYIQHCNDMAYRCDFVAIHCYWGDNEAWDANAWYNQLKAIYDATKRPIWITEWAYGASWTTESWPSDWNEKLERNRSKIKAIMQKLEEAPFVERYAYYEHDTQFRNLVDWNDGHMTPAGKVYRDTKSGFAYNADVQFTPVWWSPSVKTPTVKVQINEADNALIMNIVNDNTDVTGILKVQVKHKDTEWEDYYTEEDRSLFDQANLSYSFPLSDFDPENDLVRIYIKRTLGEEVYSAISSFGYIENPDISTSSKSDVEGWTCSKSAANGYTKADSGDTYFEVWDASANGMQFNYYQEITDLPNGIYDLSAVLFNSTNGVADAQVNGSVVLYAQTDSILYFNQVTNDSEINYDNRTNVKDILVDNGKLRIGIRNIGDMKARWAGGDSFKLTRSATLPADVHQAYTKALREQQQALCDAFMTYTDESHTEADATSFIVNPRCQRKDYYGWKVTNEGTASDKPADGVSGNAYWNLWKSSAFTSTMQQDITHLPEGEYSLSALVRGSTNESLTIKVCVLRGDSLINSASKTIKGKGEAETEGDNYKNGWCKVETPQLTVRPGDTLRIEFEAEGSNGSCWWSADNFTLTWSYIDPLPDALHSVAESTQTVNQVTYDLNGREISTPQARGIYIRNGKKTVFKSGN